MEFSQAFVFIAVFVSGGLCAGNVGLSYTDRLIGGLGKVGSHGLVRPGNGLVKTALDQCLLDCPWGTRCSVQFGTPRCVSIAAVGVGHHDVAGTLRSGISAAECLLACPIGSRCSLEFGAPECVSDAALGLGSHLGVGAGLDQLSNTIGLESSLLGTENLLGLNRCAPMTPACLATRLDRFEQCRYTFDLRRQRCVRVYVRNVCAVLNGPRRNLFSSMLECERSCLDIGRISY